MTTPSCNPPSAVQQKSNPTVTVVSSNPAPVMHTYLASTGRFDSRQISKHVLLLQPVGCGEEKEPGKPSGLKQ